MISSEIDGGSTLVLRVGTESSLTCTVRGLSEEVVFSWAYMNGEEVSDPEKKSSEQQIFNFQSSMFTQGKLETDSSGFNLFIKSNAVHQFSLSVLKSFSKN
jgi:hypothetical protein